MCGVAGGFAQNSRDIPETPQLQIRYKWRRLLLGRSSVHILFVAGLASSMQRSPIKFGLNWMMKNNMYLNYSIYLLIYVRIMNLIYALINNLSLSVSLSLSPSPSQIVPHTLKVRGSGAAMMRASLKTPLSLVHTSCSYPAAKLGKKQCHFQHSGYTTPAVSSAENCLLHII